METMRRVVTSLFLFIYSFADAQFMGLPPRVIDNLDAHINRAIDDSYFPGAQLVVGNRDEILYSQSYGYLDYSNRTPVDSATIYDLASCTKVLATTLAVMRLVDEGRLSLDSRIGQFFDGGDTDGGDTLPYAGVRVQNLLYHNSGFRSGVGVARSLVHSADNRTPLISYRQSTKNPYLFDDNYFVARYIKYDTIYTSHQKSGVQIADNVYLTPDYAPKLDSMIRVAYEPDRMGKYRYSDLNFYLLGKIIERVTGDNLSDYVSSIYNSMNVENLGFKPLDWCAIDRIAPTEYDALLRRDTVRGVVHDELAFVEGGVCGNAGLFGSAEGVAEVCGMFLRDGADYYGNEVVKTSTMQKFTLAKRFKSGGIHALGFDKVNPDDMPYPIESYGHAGFTGTYLWIDPTKDMYIVLLTNRLHPSRANRKLNGKYRIKLWDIVAEGGE